MNIDEVSRLKKIRTRQIEVIKKFRPNGVAVTLDDDYNEKKIVCFIFKNIYMFNTDLKEFIL